MKVKVVQIYGAFYIAPTPRGWIDEEEAKEALRILLKESK